MGDFQDAFFFKKRLKNFQSLQCFLPVFRQRNIVRQPFFIGETHSHKFGFHFVQGSGFGIETHRLLLQQIVHEHFLRFRLIHKLIQMIVLRNSESGGSRLFQVFKIGKQIQLYRSGSILWNVHFFISGNFARIRYGRICSFRFESPIQIFIQPSEFDFIKNLSYFLKIRIFQIVFIFIKINRRIADDGGQFFG